MPAGLAFHINYLANAVQLQVVNKPIFSADFDDDGDVDPTDLAIWKGAFDLNQLGDADGDNDSDGNDFLLWQQQFGSAPAVAVAQPAAAAVPEPSAAVMMLSLLALSALRAQHRRAPRRDLGCPRFPPIRLLPFTEIAPMPAHARLRRSTIVVLALILAWPTPLPASAAPRTWIGGNVDWVDVGAATNWNPTDEPDADDEAIFNTANAVNLGSNNATTV